MIKLKKMLKIWIITSQLRKIHTNDHINGDQYWQVQFSLWFAFYKNMQKNIQYNSKMYKTETAK